ncbi:MAG TPA: 6-phosphogluconolactonase [Gammaproteobacteria bacterium]|nr:6-phosphogluconolactonase [Gammaproteobacteria bacterium]
MMPAHASSSSSAGSTGPYVEVAADAAGAARKAAAFIAERAREASRQGRHFLLGLSGGHTPRRMFKELSEQDMPWADVHLAQVDERLAPIGPERNLTMLKEDLIAHVNLPDENIHAMPVETDDPVAAARRYGEELRGVAGIPLVLDVVHLGLGADGHTASLMPRDPVLKVQDKDVAVTTGAYGGLRRMTLSLPVLNRSRCVIWLVTGAGKAPMLERLLRGDRSLPAGRVARARATIFADRAAMR